LDVGFEHLSGCLVLYNNKELSDDANVILNKGKVTIMYHYSKPSSMTSKYQKSFYFSIRKANRPVFEGSALIEDVQLISMSRENNKNKKALVEKLVIVPNV
jgi:hypothetical protein